MIAGLRSTLICSRVDQNADGSSDYIGIMGATLMTGDKPGFIEAWVAVQVQLDELPTKGRLVVRCDGLAAAFPFAAPAGVPEAALALPLIIPVLSEGDLIVEVHDDDNPSAPLSASWRLRYAPGAEPVSAPNAAARIAAAAQGQADQIAASITRGGAGMH